MAVSVSPLPIQRHEQCSVVTVRRVAAMLDLDPDGFPEGAALPRGWQFVLLGADTRRSALRGDGFPGLGVPMPDLGLPRLMLGSRSVEFRSDLPIGAALHRTSRLESLKHKATDSGPMAVATLRHELHLDPDGEPALVETQVYLLLPPRNAPLDDAAQPDAALPTADHVTTVLPDDTLLFQYSALGFNSHRIHLDRGHAREVEGFPDLVVNGGLATLLITEFLRRELGVRPVAFKARHVAPLYCNRPMTIAANAREGRWHVKAFDDRHRMAVDMEVDVS